VTDTDTDTFAIPRHAAMLTPCKNEVLLMVQ